MRPFKRLSILPVLIGICTLGVVCPRSDAQTFPNIPNSPNAAQGEISCTGYQDFHFTATGLQPSTTYTAVVTFTTICPGSSQAATNVVNINFVTPATITGAPGSRPYTSNDFIQVGNPSCSAGPDPNGFCEDNPGLPTNTTAVQNYSPTLGINGPLSFNPSDASTNNGCRGSATITLTATPPGVPPTPVNMEGHFAPDTMAVVCTLAPSCLLTPGKTTIPGAAVSWNKFNAPSNSTVWIHAHIGTPSNLSTNQVTQIQFVGVTFAVGSKTYQLPDGFLNIDPSYTGSPTTTFDPTFAGLGAWITTLNPKNLSDEIFFDGAAVPVDSNLESGGKATFSYTTLSSDPLVTFSWQWSAAVFTFWPADWNNADILAVHNSDHAGTPENKTVQQSLIQGPRGGGGSNFTGSWSGTGQGVCTNNF